MSQAYANALPNPFLVVTPKRVKRTRKALRKSRKSNRKAK